MKTINFFLTLFVKHAVFRRLQMLRNSIFLLILSLILFNRLYAQTQYELWGMTKSGGEKNCGVIFKYNLQSATITKVLDFDDQDRGKYPQGGLILASNGKLYGLTKNGGVNDLGTLFEYDPNTTVFVKKIDFDGKSNGQWPCGTLLQASADNLYGTTLKGGKNDAGILFVFNLQSGQLIKKFDFDGKETGDSPYASLIEASNGLLYGSTINGGQNNKGVLFSFDPSTDKFKKLVDFDSDINGEEPKGNLVQTSNGKLYGTTTWGGAQNNGVLFEYDPKKNKLIVKYDFVADDGQFPAGGLVLATNEKFYGTTYWGGANDAGILFEYSPLSEKITKRTEFDGAGKGRSAQGCLMQAHNGKLYGVTTYGGGSDLGVLFEYDISTAIFKKLVDFDGTNGAYPVALKLIEVTNPPTGGVKNEDQSNSLFSIKIAPNPSCGIIRITGALKENDKIDIVDTEGKQVNFDRIDERTLNLSLLIPGIYFIRIGTQIFRVVRL
ncbi:MAG: T9SS type A sorting domain-containing protein [Bacteroidota bacterium]|nr:T9SS type A sorting domain-containing protein [Bacteroidota bacterium]